MKKLLSRFLKRFIIVPALVAIIAVVATSLVMPKVIEKSQAPSIMVASDIDISAYNLNDYKTFSELKESDYVATITSDELNLACAVCYDSTKEVNAVGLQKQSVEPWNNGNVAIVGDNITNKFKYLHNARIGTEISIDYYKNAICKYKITKVTYNNTFNDIAKELKNSDLILCVPYKDFESSNDSKLYTFYFAELGGVEEWK